MGDRILYYSPSLSAVSPAEGTRLRARAGGAYMTFAVWSRLQPSGEEYDTAAVEELRERLMRLIALGVEPVLCLYREGDAPDWFLAQGGWELEDNLRCYLRYVSRVVREVGHLVREYVTFFAPNDEVWRSGALLSLPRRARNLSHMACDHVRAYRLILDLRTQRGWVDTRVGFVLRMAPARELRRGKLPFTGTLNTAIYETLTLRAMAKGDFRLPLRNVLRVQRGQWCDFVAILCRESAEDECAVKAAAADVPLRFLQREEGFSPAGEESA